MNETNGEKRAFDGAQETDGSQLRQEASSSFPSNSNEDEEEEKEWKRETLEERLKRCGMKSWPPPPSSYQHLIPKQQARGPSPKQSAGGYNAATVSNNASLALKGMGGAAIYSLLYLMATYESEHYFIIRWIFLRCLALVFFAAFISLSVQIEGLAGSKGILPVIDTVNRLLDGGNPFSQETNIGKASSRMAAFLQKAKEIREQRERESPSLTSTPTPSTSSSIPTTSEQKERSTASVKKPRTRWEAYRLLPTLSVFDPSDSFLRLQYKLGIIVSVLLFFDFIPMISSLLCYLLYLSLKWTAMDFYLLQWDSLLLEVGFLAIFLSPPHILPTLRLADEVVPPSRFVIWLYRLLLFRLMQSAGIAKVASGDQTWRSFTALKYHFWTQPLPHRVAWYAHQLPLWANKFNTGFALVVEVLTPIFMFGSFSVRLGVFVLQVMLQIGIFLTGCYGFFNILTMCLCLFLLDDRVFPRWVLEVFSLTDFDVSDVEITEGKLATAVMVQEVLLLPITAFVVSLSIPPLMSVMQIGAYCPPELRELFVRSMPWHLSNRYGLFATMTTKRTEIVIEGSVDGQEWREYELPYKPGPVSRPPLFTPPGHLPRLDWRMWFLPFSKASWFPKLLARLLEGSPVVLKLFSKVPFTPEEGNPKYVRSVAYEYEFTNHEERKRTGNYWKRTFSHQFTPIMLSKATSSTITLSPQQDSQTLVKQREEEPKKAK